MGRARIRIGAGVLVLCVLAGLLAMHGFAGAAAGEAVPSRGASQASIDPEHWALAASDAERVSSAGADAAPPAPAAVPHCPSCAGDEAVVCAAVGCFLAVLLLALSLAAPARRPGLAAAAAVLRASPRRAQLRLQRPVPIRALLCISRT
ncbi:hypothetical protein [Agromyces soli]|uniref:DUF2946 domain-containing protein n=1 Tax=Agromyces soli TaxID=659012 RepID=A0ABY4AXW2_9MICO|nr:hypothetical protein [Agromyces soli]UOE25695.1 hypothetical protein MTP13_15425 [Agromyces soli]